MPKNKPEVTTGPLEYRTVPKRTPGALAKRLLLGTVSFVVRKSLGVHLSPESKANLQAFNNRLKDQSVVLYGHHPRMIDALVIPLVIRENLPDLNVILEPLTVLHYHGLKKLALIILGWLTDTLPLPIIREKDQTFFSPEKRTELKQTLTATTDLYLEKPSNIYGVAPAGGRAKALESKNVNPSFAKIITSRQLPAVPMAFVKVAGENEIVIGPVLEPLAKNAEIEAAVRYYMSQLAQILPEELRGDYS